VIILFNKVDDPDDEEHAEMVSEARKEVEAVFNVGDLDAATSQLLLPDRLDTAALKSLLPAVLPISATNAYFHQAASLLSDEEILLFDDQELFDKYGKDYVGRAKWKRLSKSEKAAAVCELMKNTEIRDEGLEASSFDRLLKILDKCVGAAEAQMELIFDRLNTTLNSLSAESANVTQQLATLYEGYQFVSEGKTDDGLLSVGIDAMAERFWEQHAAAFDGAISSIKKNPRSVAVLAPLMSELQRYYDFAQSLPEPQKQREVDAAIGHVQLFVESFLDTLIDLAKQCQKESDLELDEPLTPKDWVKVWGSILLVAANRHFYYRFGSQKVQIEDLLSEARSLERSNCGRCGCAYSLCSPFSDSVPIRVCANCCSIPVFSSPTKVVPEQCVLCDRFVSSEKGVCSNKFCGTVYRELEQVVRGCTNCRTVSTSNDSCNWCGMSMETIQHRHVYFGGALTIPKFISDPAHFGHVLWRYCEFMGSIKETKDSKLGTAAGSE
jgi:hypothetical protein